ncbi:MAG: ATP-dependent DNA helicase RecG [bacterium]
MRASMNLHDQLTEHFRFVEAQKAALGKLGIKTVQDLLQHFPFRYEAAGQEAAVGGLVLGQDASVVGVLEKLETKKSWKSRVPMSEGYLRDQSGRVKLMWFNQPYIAKMYFDGTRVKATGKVSGSAGKLYLANPKLERVAGNPDGAVVDLDSGLFKATPLKAEESPSPGLSAASPGGDSSRREVSPQGLFAQYPESRGVTSLWFQHAIKKVLASGVVDQVEDPVPAELLKQYNLPSLKTALVWIHTPEKAKEAEAARKRFAFEEIFLIQLQRAQERKQQAKEKSFIVSVSQEQVDSFVSTFPFTATPAQTRAIKTILKDMAEGNPMSRLLEGDVGSGKTAVAATACFAVIETRPENQDFGTLQVAYMAPTEILAKQHFESFIKYFDPALTGHPINIGLITGSGCFKFPSKSTVQFTSDGKQQTPTNISRVQLLKWIASGEIAIVIGTHALIEKSVAFKHLALVIIDEQHRFGTNQRRKLAKKEVRIPHLLSMTATPIPRTLALTVYGDLDLTLLDEMPPGRKRIITEIVKPEERASAYEKIRVELTAGRQAYVICPRIDEPDPDKAFALMAKSVTAEAKRLKKEVFPEYRFAILHSKMTPKEKDETMAKFSKHEIDILVATSVVEVGVNVPNATLIFIEGAERFGLAQLHQLRGRVVRSSTQAYCFVCPESRGEHTLARLKALATAKNGFELAEKDLLQRGAGQLVGAKQWGISDIGMDALQNLKLVEAARVEAQKLVAEDETLFHHPLLREKVLRQAQALHFE